MEEKDLHSENWIIVNFLQNHFFQVGEKSHIHPLKKNIPMKQLRDDFIVKIIVKSKASDNQII